MKEMNLYESIVPRHLSLLLVHVLFYLPGCLEPSCKLIIEPCLLILCSRTTQIQVKYKTLAW